MSDLDSDLLRNARSAGLLELPLVTKGSFAPGLSPAFLARSLTSDMDIIYNTIWLMLNFPLAAQGSGRLLILGVVSIRELEHGHGVLADGAPPLVQE